MGDIQVRGERIVYAIRRMHRISGRRITVYGHSQGGMVGRWALRFWPDTRAMVADLVGAAPSNHGTDAARSICGGGCAPSFWQQRSDSDFTSALNSRAETFRGVAYTSIYSHLDEVVVPNSDETGQLLASHRARRDPNVAVQEICPGDLSEHLLLALWTRSPGRCSSTRPPTPDRRTRRGSIVRSAPIHTCRVSIRRPTLRSHRRRRCARDHGAPPTRRSPRNPRSPRTSSLPESRFIL